MPSQSTVDRLFQSIKTAASMGTPSDITAMQDSLMEAIARERLFPTRMLVDPNAVELSESGVIAQTPEADVFHGAVGDWQAHFIWYRIHKSQNPDRYDAFFKAMTSDVVVSMGLNHRNIVPFSGIHRMNTAEIDRIYLIRPPYHSLAHHLSTRPNADRVSLLKDIIEGLAYLHSLGIVHGALTDRAILVDNSGKAFLSDFSQAFREGTQFTTDAYIQNMNSSLHNIVWRAPELLEGLTTNAPVAPTKATDIYALGCLAYKVFTGMYPFEEPSANRPHPGVRAISKIMCAVLSGGRPDKPNVEDAAFVENGLTEEIWTTIELCWSRDPHSRPDARAVGSFLTTNVADGQSDGE